ncbi:MAG: hypothetical protein FWD82_10330 [Defluviitaleaceae bacterium]|nr:hypothetical protein [Defluviitaleaceae bacterium]
MKKKNCLFLLLIVLILAACPLTDEDDTPTHNSFSFNPRHTTVVPGGTATFSVRIEVAGMKNPSQYVIWTVEGGKMGTYISNNGVLNVSNNETDNTILYISVHSPNYSMETRRPVLIHNDADKIIDFFAYWINPLFDVFISGENLYINGRNTDNSFSLSNLTWEPIENTLDNSELYPNGFRISGIITSKKGTGWSDIPNQSESYTEIVFLSVDKKSIFLVNYNSVVGFVGPNFLY